MGQSKYTPKHGNKNAPQLRVAPMKQTNPLKQDEVMANIIRKINDAIASATVARMGTALDILQVCREELVHWAVDMDFHETAKDRFIHEHMYDGGLLAMGEFFSRVSDLKDEKLKSKIIQLLGASMAQAGTRKQ